MVLIVHMILTLDLTAVTLNRPEPAARMITSTGTSDKEVAWQGTKTATPFSAALCWR